MVDPLGKSERPRWQRSISGFFGSIASVGGALGFTVVLFCVLPLINRIAGAQVTYDVLEVADEFVQPDQEEVIEEPEEEIEEEEEPEEEPPPELEQDVEPLSLEQLEMSLAGGAGGDGFGGGLVDLSGIANDIIASVQGDGPGFGGGRPQPTSQPLNLTPREAKVTPGSAIVRFIVDENGRVQTPILKEATHPLLGQAALREIKKWRFTPVRKDGKPVRTPVSQRVEFPAYN